MGWQEWMMQARQGRGPLRLARPLYRRAQNIRLPLIRPFWGALYATSRLARLAWRQTTKILWREPIFRYLCTEVGRGLVLEGDVPQIVGNGTISVGDNVRIGTRNSWAVGFKASTDAQLIIGDRVSVNYQTIISVAKKVSIGDHTMIAGNVQIYDNISHPISPRRRLAYEPFTLDEASPVHIGRNVWIGQAAIIMRGVTIGDNSVVAAGSIVTKSVPPNTLVGGNPARILRNIEDDLGVSGAQ